MKARGTSPVLTRVTLIASKSLCAAGNRLRIPDSASRETAVVQMLDGQGGFLIAASAKRKRLARTALLWKHLSL